MNERVGLDIVVDRNEIPRNAAQAAAAVKGLGDEVRRQDRQVGSSTRSVDRHTASVRQATAATAGWDRAIGRFNAKATLMRNVIALVRFPAFITGAGLATQAVAALTAAVVGLSAALAPAAGALAAYPALGSAAAQGIGTVTLASKGLKRELETLAPQLEGLQRRAERGLLPGVERGIDDALRNLPKVQRAVSETSRTLGALAEKGGAWLGSAAVGRDFERQAERNRVTIQRLGTASLHLADATRHVAMEAGPLVDWLTTGTVHLARWVDQEARAARQTGELRDFFAETRWVLEILGGTLVDTAAALGDVGAAAQPLGEDILLALRDAAAGWRRWTESVEGQRQLADYFENAKPAIFETGRLARDAALAFLRLGNQPGVANLLKQVRTELLPVLEDLIGVTTTEFGPHLIDALVEITELFATLAGSSGPLTAFVDAIGYLAHNLNELLQSNPALKSALVTMAGAAGVIKAMKFGAAISGVRTLADAYKNLGRQASVAAGATAGANAAGAGGAAAGGAAGRSGGARSTLLAAGRVAGPIAIGILATNIAATELEKQRLPGVANKAKNVASEFLRWPSPAKATHLAIKGVSDLLPGIGGGASKFVRQLEDAEARAKGTGSALGGVALNVKRANAELKGSKIAFDFGLAIRSDKKNVRKAVSDLIAEAKKLEPGSRGAAKRAALAMVDELQRGGSLSKKEAGRIKRLVVGEFSEMRTQTRRQSSRLAGETASNLAALGDVVLAQMGGLINAVNGALKALGVNPVKWTAKAIANPGGTAARGARGLVDTFGTAPPPGTRDGRGNARGGLHQIGRPGEKGRDSIPMRIGDQNVMVGSGEVAAVLNRDQQAALNERLADVGGLPGFFRKPWRPHYMATGGMVGALAGARATTSWRGKSPAGLNPAIKSIAQWAMAKYGATASSTLRPGDAGSHHSTGAAVDLTSGDMLKMARGIDAAFRPKLNELIHTPLGYSIDNGRRVPPFAQADHYDHVHAAAMGNAVLAAGALAGDFVAKRIKMGGPAGAAKQLAEAGLNKVARATESYYAKNAPSSFGGGFDTAGLPADVRGAVEKLAEARGWNASDWMWIIDHESGGRAVYNAQGSGAFGVGQLMPATYARYGGGPGSSLTEQVAAMAAYIADRYGTPTRARQFWEANGWYGKGGIVAAAKGMLTGALAKPRGKDKKAATGPKGGKKPKKKKPDPRKPSRRVRDLAKRKPRQLGDDGDRVWGALEKRRDTADKTLDLVLGPTFDRLRAEYLVDHDDNTATPDIVNWDGVTVDGKQIPGINAAVAELNKQIANRQVVEQTMNDQVALARMALHNLGEAIKRRRKLWETMLAKVKKQATRIKQIKTRLRAIDKKKKPTKAEKAEAKRLENELIGLRASQRLLTGEDEPSIDDRSWKENSDSPAGRAYLAIGEATEKRDEWQARADDLPWQIIGVGNEIEDLRMQIADATGTKPPKPDSPATDESALKDLLLEQKQSELDNLRLQLAQQGVFNAFGAGLVGGLGGFARGTLRVANTGLAVVHKDEAILSDPQGPFGTQIGRGYPNQIPVAGGDGPQVTIVVDGDVAPLLNRVRAMVDGVEQRVNVKQGRQARQLQVAPGRG